jgi:hypothetical protein
MLSFFKWSFSFGLSYQKLVHFSPLSYACLLPPPPSSSHKLSFTSSLLSSHGAGTFRTIALHQRPLNIIYDILSLMTSTLLSADTILLCTKKPVPNWWSPFPSNNMLPRGEVSWLMLWKSVKFGLFILWNALHAKSSGNLH